MGVLTTHLDQLPGINTIGTRGKAGKVGIKPLIGKVSVNDQLSLSGPFSSGGGVRDWWAGMDSSHRQSKSGPVRARPKRMFA